MSDLDLSPAQQRKSSAILEAARTHFAAHGFEATKLSDVAKDSGVAVGTIYLRYKSKAELLAGVLEEVERSFCDAMDTPAIWGAPFPARFSLVIVAMLETASRHDDIAKLMALSAQAVRSPKTQKQLMLNKIAAHLRDGVARGELRSDLDLGLCASMAHGMVEGAMREMMSNPDRDPADTVAHLSGAYEMWLSTGADRAR